LEYYKKPFKNDQKYQFWQEGSHPEKIIDRDMLNQKLEYMHYNPVTRRYVDEPAYWRYSSYRNYIGEKGLLPIEIITL